MGSLDQALMDQILEHQLDLLRFEAGVRARVLAMLELLRRELAAKLAAEDITSFNKARMTKLLREATIVIDNYYAQMQGAMDTSLTAAARSTASNVSKALAEPMALIQLAAGLPTQTFLERLAGNTLVLGAPSAEWWSKQSADTVFKFGSAVRQGLISGESNEQIVRRVVGTRAAPGIMTGARHNIRSLVHTSIQAVANSAQLESFRKNADVIKELSWLATLDSHTCEICGPRDLKRYTLMDDPPQPVGHVLDWEGGPGAIHWGCRCDFTPVMKTFRELGVNIDQPAEGTRASSDGQVKASTTFEGWLSRRTVAQQDEQLGVGRAALWRKGTITLEQLLSLDGNILSLAQLEKRYL